MTITKALTATGYAVLAVGLLVGLREVTAHTSDDGVAKPNMPAAQAGTSQKEAGGKPPGDPAAAAEAARKKEMYQLEAQASTARVRVDRLEKRVKAVLSDTDAPNPRVLERLKRDYELKRRLAEEALAEETKAEREALRSFEKKQKDAADKVVSETAGQAYDTARRRRGEQQVSIDRIDEEYEQRLREAEGLHGTPEQRAAYRQRLALELESEKLKLAALELKIAQAGGRSPTPAAAPVGVEAKLDKLLQEVEELRKEVRELKGK